MLPVNLDRIDIRILTELQNDARLTNVELARRVNLSPSPCLARVRALERAGIVNRYVALVNPAAVGLGLNVFSHVSLERQVEKTLQQFQSAIHRYPEIVECYLMTGDADFMLRVVVPDVQALEQFILNGLTRISGVASIRSSFALKQVKYDTALPLAALKSGTTIERRASKRGASGTSPRARQMRG